MDYSACCERRRKRGHVDRETLQERREQFHLLRLNEQLDLFNQNVTTFAHSVQSYLFQHTGDRPLSQEMTWQVLANLREQQASSLAFFDVFWVAAMVAFALVFLVFFMKRSVAEKGAHVAAD